MTLNYCISCDKKFEPKLDDYICDVCVNEAYEGQPLKFMRITLHGGRSYVQPLDKLNEAFDGDTDGAPLGTKWTLELIEMTRSEYKALPDFAGH